jgi:hypothetical protein
LSGKNLLDRRLQKFLTAENRPKITEAPAALQQNGRRHIQNSDSGLLIGWFYSSSLSTSF